MIKGSKHSLEARRKISEMVRGERHPGWGKSPSPETRLKISLANRDDYPVDGAMYRDADWLKEHYWNKGLTLAGVGKAAGVCWLTIYRWMSKLGIPMRKGNWKGGRIRHCTGYILIWKPDHPYAQSGKYVAEHRLVMEKILGRYLEPLELVHHKNGIRDDNRSENLELVIRRDHVGAIQCPHCGRTFQIH